MSRDGEHGRATELLQQLGLKEYEARCLIALVRVSDATAKEVSDASEVPRTRVYDAVRVLESKGLVEVQHVKPQRFRAVPVPEAVETLRRQYDSRLSTLESEFERLHDTGAPSDGSTHEVWSLLNRDGIESRTRQLVDDAAEEVVLAVGTASAASDGLLDALADAEGRGVRVVVGTFDGSTRDRIEAAVGDGEVSVSGLEWLHASDASADGGVTVGRLLLVDGETVLVSSVPPESSTERAVFGRGFDNGLVLIARRLLETGLLRHDGTDPTDGGEGADGTGE